MKLNMDQRRMPVVEVTEVMVDAGMSELVEHSFGEDRRYILECVYRAMAYAKPAPDTSV